MLVVTTQGVSGHTLETLGFVCGSTIQCKNIGRDIGSSFKTLIGGELQSYTDMMNEARDIAMDRMIAKASGMGADAIVAVHLTTSSVMQGAAEICAYGTAVRFQD